MINLPIYRAKSNERKNIYVEGLLIGVDAELNLCTIRTKDDYIGGEICYLDTLSINIEDMLDSQGNKIFASLQEDGKGGDITDKGICMYISKNHQFRIITNIKTMNWLEITRKDLDNYSLKIIGIQQ